MDSTVQIAAIIAASIVIPVTAGIVMGGFYFVTAYKQEQLNLRENIRTQRALANAGVSQGSGEMDLMSLAQAFLPVLMKNGQQPINGVLNNGEIQQSPGVGGSAVR